MGDGCKCHPHYLYLLPHPLLPLPSHPSLSLTPLPLPSPLLLSTYLGYLVLFLLEEHLLCSLEEIGSPCHGQNHCLHLQTINTIGELLLGKSEPHNRECHELQATILLHTGVLAGIRRELNDAMGLATVSAV